MAPLLYTPLPSDSISKQTAGLEILAAEEERNSCEAATELAAARMWSLLPLLLLLSSVRGQDTSTQPADQDDCITQDELIKELLEKKEVGAKRPGKVDVEVTFWMQTVGPFADDGASMNFYFYLDQQWADERVKWERGRVCGSPEKITVRGEAAAAFWRPDLGFVQAMQGSVMHSPLQNDFLLIYASGTVWANQRVHISAPCAHDWAAFPKDKIACKLLPQSLSMPLEELDLRWKPGQILLLREVQLPQFNLSAVRTTRHVHAYPAGNWPELELEMEFSRLPGFFLRNLYVPSAMSLCVCLLSFLLSPASITARLLLCLQGLFFLLALSIWSRWGSPQLSVMTIADQWMGSCFAFVFVALCLNILSHRLETIKWCSRLLCCRRRRSHGYTLETSNGEANGEARKILAEEEEAEEERKLGGGAKRRCSCLSSTVDLIGLLVLPLLFALFSAYYFNAL